MKNQMQYKGNKMNWILKKDSNTELGYLPFNTTTGDPLDDHYGDQVVLDKAIAETIVKALNNKEAKETIIHQLNGIRHLVLNDVYDKDQEVSALKNLLDNIEKLF